MILMSLHKNWPVTIVCDFGCFCVCLKVGAQCCMGGAMCGQRVVHGEQCCGQKGALRDNGQGGQNILGATHLVETTAE